VSGFTPGPWEVTDSWQTTRGGELGVQAKTLQGPGYPTPNATGYYAMALPPPHDKALTGEQNANDLLEALENLLKEAELEHNADVGATHTEICIDTLIEAKQAIAKARGES